MDFNLQNSVHTLATLAAKANVDRLMSMEIEHSFEQESNRTFAKESI